MKTRDVPDTTGDNVALLLELLRQFLLVVVLEGRVGDDDERNAQPESTQDASRPCQTLASNWILNRCVRIANV